MPLKFRAMGQADRLELTGMNSMRIASLMHCVLAAILCAVLPAAYALAQAAPPSTMNGLPLLYQEDFESGADGWTMTDSAAWEVVADEAENHALALKGSSDYDPKVRSPRSIARIENIKVGSFVFDATLTQTGRDYDHRDLCIFFGYNDPSKFYYVHMATRADPHAHSIFLVNDAARVSIAQERTEGVIWDDEPHRVRITRDADSGAIEVFFDDMAKPIMRTVDKTFTSGAIGVGSFDDTGQFDDIRIWGESAAK